MQTAAHGKPYVLLQKHQIANTAQNALGRCDKVTVSILTERFDAHPFCPYTGKKLEIGGNAQLDHVMSKQNHPELAGDIDNLEWVSATANYAKRGLNKPEFIDLCKLIASRF